MVLIRKVIACFLVILAIAALPVMPSQAHEGHKHGDGVANAGAPPVGNAQAVPAHDGGAGAVDGHQMAGMDMDEERPTTLGGRLLGFLGHMHPFAVHFPIALIPASWIALIIARRRGHAVEAFQVVVVLAGLAAVAAAAMGWLNAGFAVADEDPVQTYHRWLGTALALIVGGIAIWAMRRDAIQHRAMTWALGTASLLLLVQGWLGATLTHGAEHMTF